MTANVFIATDTVLTGFPVTLTATVRDIDGYLADPSTIPVVEFIVDPNGDALPGYPVDMTRIDVGIYEYDLDIPAGLANIGTYTVSIIWPFPGTNEPQYLYITVFASYPLRNSYVAPR
jgi:hypothetical protein